MRVLPCRISRAAVMVAPVASEIYSNMPAKMGQSGVPIPISSVRVLSLPFLALAKTLLLVIVVGLIVSAFAAWAALQAPLLATLKRELQGY